ncbi:MAG: thioredoxin family protein [Weeksellaceae bacterium]
MKTIILSLLSLFIFTSCAMKNQEKENTKKEEKVLVNKEVEVNGQKMLKGAVNEETFRDAKYDWYDTYYDSYTLDEKTIDTFKNELQELEIEVFMGTWCPDSHRETPHFFKIMDYAGYPDNRIEMYAVDRDKKSLNGEEAGKDISHVPTFLFYKDGKEIGRIVESPINSLEEDIRDIVNGTPQTPNYAY